MGMSLWLTKNVNTQRTAFLLFLLYFVETSSSEATPEDWVPSPLNFPEDHSFIAAVLNITFKTEQGWRWDKTDGRYGGSYVGK